MAMPVIEMIAEKDPKTGEEVWVAPPSQTDKAEADKGVSATRDGTLRHGDHVVTLPDERFAGDTPASIGAEEDGWIVAAGQQAMGRTVSLTPSGELVVTDNQGAPQAAVQLTSDRFASGLGASTLDRYTAENRVVADMGAARTTWVSYLKHTTRVQGMPAGAPTGWLFRPRPNRYGDQLVCVVARHTSTGLYHSHFWRYEADLDGRGRVAVDLPRFLGRAPHLTHHRAHLYSGPDGSAVLCLSERAGGGMPAFDTALLQTLRWADGTGEVVRGRAFPYA